MTRPLQKFPTVWKSGPWFMQIFCEILEYFPLKFWCGTNKHSNLKLYLDTKYDIRTVVILWTFSEKVGTDRSWMNCQRVQRRVRQAAAATREKGGGSRDTETGQDIFRLNDNTVGNYYGIWERYAT